MGANNSPHTFKSGSKLSLSPPHNFLGGIQKELNSVVTRKPTPPPLSTHTHQGRIQDFKLGGGGGGIKKTFRVFRVKNHDFTPKNHFFPILGRAPRIRPCTCYKLLSTSLSTSTPLFSGLQKMFVVIYIYIFVSYTRNLKRKYNSVTTHASVSVICLVRHFICCITFQRIGCVLNFCQIRQCCSHICSRPFLFSFLFFWTNFRKHCFEK